MPNYKNAGHGPRNIHVWNENEECKFCGCHNSDMEANKLCVGTEPQGEPANVKRGDRVTVNVAYFHKLGSGEVLEVSDTSALVDWRGDNARRWIDLSLIVPSPQSSPSIHKSVRLSSKTGSVSATKPALSLGNETPVSVGPPPSEETRDGALGELEWTYSAYRATLYRHGESFAIVTPDGVRALSDDKMIALLNALNHETE